MASELPLVTCLLVANGERRLLRRRRSSCAVDEGASDFGLELGGVPLHARGEVGRMPLEDGVETEQHARREGIEQLRCSSAQTDSQVHEAAAVEQIHTSAVHLVPFEVSTQIGVGMLI